MKPGAPTFKDEFFDGGIERLVPILRFKRDGNLFGLPVAQPRQCSLLFKAR